jgi:hypothetical protein
MKETTAVTTIPKWEMPGEPSWDRARELVGSVRRSVEDIIRLGIELQALKEQWFNQGGDGKFTVRDRGVPNREKGQQIEFRDVLGWQRKIEAELGFSHKTASRIIERAQYVSMLRDLAQGEEVEYHDMSRRVQKVLPSGDMQQLAASALEDVVTGAKSPMRAWAGVVGEGSRRDDGGTRDRGEPDYGKQAAPTSVRMRNAFNRWAHIKWTDEEQAARAEREVTCMLIALPSVFRAALVDIVVEQWSPHEQTALFKALERKRKVK